MGPGEQLRAWSPSVPGVTEVLHARFTEHAYPAHVHDVWTVLVVDEGAVVYDLDRHERGAVPRAVSVLPPGVAHDGRSAVAGGFRKRVVYVDGRWLGDGLVGASVRSPAIVDEELRRALGALHGALALPGDELAAESWLALAAQRITQHLDHRHVRAPVRDRRVAVEVRERLDADLTSPPTLERLARDLGVAPTSVVRAFRREWGLPPHRYVTTRRVDRARRMLLQGEAAADVAAALGFHDQSHLTRHFRQVLGVPPALFARSAA